MRKGLRRIRVPPAENIRKLHQTGFSHVEFLATNLDVQNRASWELLFWLHFPARVIVRLNSVCWLYPKTHCWTNAAHAGLINVHLNISRDEERVISWHCPKRRRKNFPHGPTKPFLVSHWLTLVTCTFLNQSLAKGIKGIWSQLLQVILPLG